MCTRVLIPVPLSARRSRVESGLVLDSGSWISFREPQSGLGARMPIRPIPQPHPTPPQNGQVRGENPTRPARSGKVSRAMFLGFKRRQLILDSDIRRESMEILVPNQGQNPRVANNILSYYNILSSIILLHPPTHPKWHALRHTARHGSPSLRSSAVHRHRLRGTPNPSHPASSASVARGRRIGYPCSARDASYLVPFYSLPPQPQPLRSRSAVGLSPVRRAAWL